MTPIIVTINADILEKLWRNVVEQVTSIGYNVAVTMTDGHSANMKIFNEKLLQDTSTPPKTYSLPNRWKLGCLMFCLYDTVHLFKNIYNNWANKKLFVCPNVDENGEKSELKPNFHHLEELYELEHGMFPKMAHKLTDKVLHPQSIEKQMLV